MENERLLCLVLRPQKVKKRKRVSPIGVFGIDDLPATQPNRNAWTQNRRPNQHASKEEWTQAAHQKGDFLPNKIFFSTNKKINRTHQRISTANAGEAESKRNSCMVL